MKKINLLLSGGEDSFYCSIILKILKYDFFCSHILNLNYFNKKNIIKNILILSKLINIKIFFFNFKIFYKKKIFLKFLKNYNNKKIINPDIICNKLIKFNLIKFFKKKILSGHYLLVKNNKKKFFKISHDFNRDQSFFFINFKENKKNILFILGKSFKINLKKIFLKKFNIFNFKKSSRGICFLENKNIKKLIQNYIFKKIIYFNKFYKTKKKIFLNFHKNLFKINLNFFVSKKKKIFIFKKLKTYKKNYMLCKLNNSKFFKLIKLKKIFNFLYFIKIKDKVIYNNGQKMIFYYKKLFYN